jgi:hypothetical protein
MSDVEHDDTDECRRCDGCGEKMHGVYDDGDVLCEGCQLDEMAAEET